MTPFLAKLESAWPLERWREHAVAVAVSGGADSVALLRGMAELAARCEPGTSRAGARIVVLHFNHQLRGEAADADEAFVVELARGMQRECCTGRPLQPIVATGGGMEAAAREARYHFFTQAAEARGCRYVITGHTENDQLETVLFRMLRGTGIAGIAGMPRARTLSPAVTLLRPMLSITRSEVLEYLASLDQPYCDDATNDEDTFTRNRIRNLVLPMLEHEMPGCSEALLRLSSQAAQAQQIVDRLVLAQFDSLVESRENRVLVSRPNETIEPYLVAEILVHVWKQQNWPRKDLTQKHLEQLVGLLLSREAVTTAAWMFPPRIQATRTATGLALRMLEK